MTEFFCEMTEAFCKLSRCQVGKPFVAIRRVSIFASASSVEAALTAVRNSDIVDQDSVVHVYTKLLSLQGIQRIFRWINYFLSH